jgi:hypothetical protein
VKKSLRRALVATGVLVALAGISAHLMFSHTDPRAIRWKIRIIGSTLTYAPLASDDANWGLVLKGVRFRGRGMVERRGGPPAGSRYPSRRGDAWCRFHSPRQRPYWRPTNPPAELRC